MVHYKFEGDVTSITPELGTSPPFDLQSTLTVLLDYEGDTPSINPDPAIGQYEGVIDSLTINVGTYTVTIGPQVFNNGLFNTILLSDQPPGGIDALLLTSGLVGGGAINGATPVSLVINLQDPTGSVFESAALGFIGPLPPSISAFQGGNNFYQLLFDTGDSVSGSITSVSLTAVPLPPAVILFGVGLVALIGLGAGRWRSKQF